MADNHIAGEYTFASDDIGAVHHARVKVMHGADGAATDVSTASPLPVGGAAADDAAAAGNPVPIGGLYQATPDVVDDGDVGRVRMSARRAIVNAADSIILSLSPTTPVPSGSDIVKGNGNPLLAENLALRSLDWTDCSVPFVISGWRTIALIVDTLDGAFDQALTLYVYGQSALSGCIVCLASMVIPPSAVQFSVGNGAVGQGGVAGGATVANGAHYNLPAISAGWPYLYLAWSAQVAPSAGSLRICVARSS